MEQTEENDDIIPMSGDTETSADTPFEPTIDELVNDFDFDDEQTLREEEALAATEDHLNPLDEIEALKEESEMPLEELLAKYALPPRQPNEEGEPRRKKRKKTSKHNKTKTKNQKPNENSEAEIPSTTNTKENSEPVEDKVQTEQVNGQQTDFILIESGDEDMTEDVEDNHLEVQSDDDENESPSAEQLDADESGETNCPETLKIRRSHLFELYPDQNFDDAIAAAQGGAITPETLSSDDDDDDAEEEEEIYSDNAKKTIMVGSAYQAVIPGLSQYGDILPYENEDKLVWEPSQVSEAEVEEYLLKIREIKSSLSDEDILNVGAAEKSEGILATNDVALSPKPNSQLDPSQTDEEQKVQKTSTENVKSGLAETDSGGVVKDNEQALHLLVQCGYDFKEALRRKRLNAVPLGSTMSIWSEEECQKFEEGIQLFGKDFLKIRQNQVRSRTMRELVQFYYLWKKSERRDHNFANADTVDHMDIYLNEGEDYSSPGSASHSATTTSASVPCRKINGCNQNNFSIMTGSQTGTSPVKVNAGSISNKKQRAIVDSSGNNFQISGNTKTNGSNNNDQNSSMPFQNTIVGQTK